MGIACGVDAICDMYP